MSSPTDLVERRRLATARSSVLVAQSADLLAHLAERRCELARQRAETAAMRDAVRSARPGVRVRVAGMIGQRPVEVCWNGRLAGDHELIRRAEVVVAIGERWDTSDLGIDGPSRVVVASLAAPALAVALTLMRACTRVMSVELATLE